MNETVGGENCKACMGIATVICDRCREPLCESCKCPCKPAPKQSNEQLYFDFLTRITRYQSVERLRKHSEKDWGLPFEEALESAYENVIEDARRAIKGKRRPKQ